MTLDADRVAAEVESAATETGMGFLLARVLVDQIVSGALSANANELERTIGTEALGLLLERAGADAVDRALLLTLAVAPEPGMPSGEIMEAAARALGAGPEAEVGLSRQLDFLTRFGRFVVEERSEGEVLYRLFHPAIRDELLEQAGGIESEQVGAMVEAMLELRERRDAPDGFLRDALPKLIAAHGRFEPISRAVAGAPAEVLDAQVDALLGRAEERRAMGDEAAAAAVAQKALLVSGGRGGRAEARSLSAQAESFVANFDLWREARDMSRHAIALAGEAVERAPDSAPALAALLEASGALAHSLGTGAFDAEQAIDPTRSAVVQAAGADPETLLAVAPRLADLFQRYPDSLDKVVDRMSCLDAAAAASRVRAWLVEAGREDLRVELGMSLTYEGLAYGEVDPRGVDRLRRAAEVVFGLGALLPAHVVKLGQIVGELAQGLGMRGDHEEALEALNGAMASYESALASAQPGDRFPLSVAGTLQLRSAVQLVLGRHGEAILDGERAVELAKKHNDPEHPLRESLAPLALGLLDDGRAAEARDALEAAERLDPLERRVLALCRGRILREADDRAAAVEELSAALDPPALQLPVVDTRILAARFLSYALELRLGDELALADEHDADREQVRVEAARTYLRLEGGASPRRLLHIAPWLLERFRQPLARALAEGGAVPEERLHVWVAALEILHSGGRQELYDSFAGAEAPGGRPLPAEVAIERAEAGRVAKSVEAADECRSCDWPARPALQAQLKLRAALRPDAAESLLTVASRLDRALPSI